MIKKVNVTFDFDVETEKVSNVNCNVDEVSVIAKKTTISRTKKPKDDGETDPIIRLEAAKYSLNNKAVEALKAEYGCRIIIKYEKFGNRRMPVIGTDLAWDEEGNGNKITKTNTVSCRGKANTILAEYDSEFNLIPYKGDIYKMVPVNEPQGTSIENTTSKKEEIKNTQNSSDTILSSSPQEDFPNIEEIKEMSRNNTDTDEITDFSFSL